MDGAQAHTKFGSRDAFEGAVDRTYSKHATNDSEHTKNTQQDTQTLIAVAHISVYASREAEQSTTCTSHTPTHIVVCFIYSAYHSRQHSPLYVVKAVFVPRILCAHSAACASRRDGTCHTMVHIYIGMSLAGRTWPNFFRPKEFALKAQCATTCCFPPTKHPIRQFSAAQPPSPWQCPLQQKHLLHSRIRVEYISKTSHASPVVFGAVGLCIPNSRTWFEFSCLAHCLRVPRPVRFAYITHNNQPSRAHTSCMHIINLYINTGSPRRRKQRAMLCAIEKNVHSAIDTVA